MQKVTVVLVLYTTQPRGIEVQIQRNLKKKAASVVLATATIAVISAIVLVITTRKANAGEKKPEEEPTYRLQNESHRIDCYDTTPGDCQEAIELLEQLQKHRREIRDSKESKKQHKELQQEEEWQTKNVGLRT